MFFRTGSKFSLSTWLEIFAWRGTSDYLCCCFCVRIINVHNLGRTTQNEMHWQVKHWQSIHQVFLCYGLHSYRYNCSKNISWNRYMYKDWDLLCFFSSLTWFCFLYSALSDKTILTFLPTSTLCPWHFPQITILCLELCYISLLADSCICVKLI